MSHCIACCDHDACCMAS